MKNLILAFFIVCVCPAMAQTTDPDKIYFTSGGELIFSLANMTIDGKAETPILRFSPFFNMQLYVHKDFSGHVGVMTGLTLRNVGVIYDVPGTAVRKKARTYNLGIPVGFKVGNMNGTFFYAGYEFELAYNYKEKTFENDDKISKISVWFNDRVNLFQHGFFAGVQFPFRGNVKFKYYLSNFYNKGYVLVDQSGDTTRPYENFDVNIFYVSFSYSLVKEDHFMHSKSKTYSARR